MEKILDSGSAKLERNNQLSGMSEAKAEAKRKPRRLHGLDGGRGSLGIPDGSLDSPFTMSSPLDDLLSDIRRSRTASIASTPSAVSSEGEGEQRGHQTFSREELSRMGEID